MRKVILLCAVAALAQQPQPQRSIILLTPNEVMRVQDIQLRLAMLVQEQRALNAEHQILDNEQANLRDEKCRSLGATDCALNLDDPNPSHWSIGWTKKVDEKEKEKKR